MSFPTLLLIKRLPKESFINIVNIYELCFTIIWKGVLPKRKEVKFFYKVNTTTLLFFLAKHFDARFSALNLAKYNNYCFRNFEQSNVIMEETKK